MVVLPALRQGTLDALAGREGSEERWAGAATGAFLGSLALLVGGLYWFVSNFEVTF